MTAEKAMRGGGWRLVLAQPLLQSFHFERWVGRRRVAAVILVAKTTPRAWLALRKTIQANAPEDGP